MGPTVQVRYKIDTGAGANVMPLNVFRMLCPAMCDYTGKSLETWDSVWDHPDSI